MTISQTNYKSNLVESIYNKLKTIVGTTYTNSGLGNLTITYVVGYPPDITIYKDSLPVIIIGKPVGARPEQFEQGGNRKYSDNLYIEVIAGGYNDEYANEFLKNYLTDKIVFGFDQKVYSFTNYDTSTIEGIYNCNCTEMARTVADVSSVYERHHSVAQLTVWTTINNN